MRRASMSLAILLALAGCSGTTGTEPSPGPPSGHPFPDGDAWPAQLSGPFDLASLEDVRATSFDGTTLAGWLYRPALPEGVRAPTILWTHAYYGQTDPPGDDPAIRDNSNAAEAVPIDLLVSHGYAVALFNVRGTGNSGGCFELMGPREQQDQAVLVEWVAAQPWSNGRVGMMGLSYHGTTPLMAATFAPPALKTIVVSGIVSDLYTFFHSLQGAAHSWGGAFAPFVTGLVSLAPPARDPQGATVDHLGPLLSRACPDVIDAMSKVQLGAAVDRDAAFWQERSMVLDYPNVTTSVLFAHGIQDRYNSGHEFQEDYAWQNLPNAQKRMMLGQWRHQFPNYNTENPAWRLGDWNETLLGWLDYWLKGIGSAAPHLGEAAFQDDAGAWHASTQWPPAASRDHALYLSAGELTTEPGAASQTYQNAPASANPPYDAFALDAPTVRETGAAKYLCPTAGAVPQALVYRSEPADAAVIVAGNPFAFLDLTSSMDGGLVALDVFELEAGFECRNGLAYGVKQWTESAADLRYHEGNFVAKPFPTDTPTRVRIDLPNIAAVLEPGHRLAVVVGPGDTGNRSAAPYGGTITVHGDSQLVLPLLEGQLGTAVAGEAYPPRPFFGP